MAILSAKNLRLSFGALPLLEGVELDLETGERVALVGRNGVGKTSLMRVLGGEVQPEEGTIRRSPGLRVARLEQKVPPGSHGTVIDLVTGGLGETGELLSAYHHTSHLLASDSTTRDRLLAELEKIQHRLEASGGWLAHRQVEAAIDHLGLDAEKPVAELSGGQKRRAFLARALASNPDLLLLDEPTNHLDLQSIEWLEGFLEGTGMTLLFVTHDRAFLKKLATRILELDRGRLISWPGNYEAFLQKKQENLEVEQRQNSEFDKKLAKEEVWIRQGIKARRTRNEGRVRSLEKMREERRQRRQQTGQARFGIEEAQRSGQLVIEAEGVEFGWTEEEPLIKNFSLILRRKDKVGILGPNGSGKTTLIQLLLGDLTPRTGTIHHGTKLQVAYFDQHRVQLDEEASVMDNVTHGEYLEVGGKKRHLISYLGSFLFQPEQCRGPVKALSGGERNRLLLARLFAQPSNVLVMDEPTNDLDVETLELLEELLYDYAGTLLLVSHDRDFLDQVVSSTLVFEGKGRVREYVGGYSDWLAQKQSQAPQTPTAKPAEKPKKPKSNRPAKLTYRQNQELGELPARIESLEEEQGQLHQNLADPELYRQRPDEVGSLKSRVGEVEAALETAYARWEELETLSQGSKSQESTSQTSTPRGDDG